MNSISSTIIYTLRAKRWRNNTKPKATISQILRGDIFQQGTQTIVDPYDEPFISFGSLCTRLLQDILSKQALKCQYVQAAGSCTVSVSLKYMAFALNVTVNVTAVVAPMLSVLQTCNDHMTATATCQHVWWCFSIWQMTCVHLYRRHETNASTQNNAQKDLKANKFRQLELEWWEIQSAQMDKWAFLIKEFKNKWIRSCHTWAWFLFFFFNMRWTIHVDCLSTSFLEEASSVSIQSTISKHSNDGVQQGARLHCGSLQHKDRTSKIFTAHTPDSHSLETVCNSM